MALSSWNSKLEDNFESAADRTADLRVSPFAGGGEMGALMRALDWSQTPIGPVANWPQSLKTAVRIILTSRYAMFVWWGRELVNLYNDPYRAFLGSKHPAALGKSACDVWAEIWDQIGPRAEAVLLRGESTYDESLLLLMERHGYVEETYFTFAYSPLPDDEGEVHGLFCAVTETTPQVIGERRLTLLREIAAEMAESRTPAQVCQSAARCLSEALRDLPFSLIYLLDPQGKILQRAGEAGIPTDHPAAPESVSLETNDESVWPFRRVLESGQPVMIEDLSHRITKVPRGAWNRASECAILLPIAQQGQTRPAGVFVAGLNPYRKFTDEFRGFVSLLSNQIAGAIANAVAYETERRRAHLRAEVAQRETRLRKEAEIERGRLQELLAKVPAAIAVTSGPDHRWSSVNEAFVSTTGRKSANDFLGKTAKESLPEIEGQGVLELLDRVYRSGKLFVGRERLVHLDRSGSGTPSEAYFDFVYQPVRDAAGKTEGILIHAVDVTAQVRARHTLMELSEARHRLAAIVESSDDAIVSKDLNGIVTSWNAGAEKTFGYTAQEIVGKPIITIIPPELHSDETRILSTIARGDRIEHFETVRVHKNGERINISLTVSPVKDETGRIIGAAKIARDITQQKRAEQALRTTERLASVGRLAATIAHEINNPLEAITNLVYLAKHNASQDDVRGYLARAEEELERVSHLTKQTLGFYRDTKGATPTRVGFLLTGLLTVFASRIRNKAIDIRPQIKSDPEIIAIPGEIRQVIANLLANSIDAVDDKGTIRIRLASGRDWKSGRTPGVRLTVADTGYGISPAARRKVFEPFFTTRKDVGTGLGLWVCKNIVEKHNGSIRVRSNATPGRSWTVFSVFLPSQPTAEEGLIRAAQSGQI